METCPKCGSRFPAGDTWVLDPSFVALVGLGWWDMRVRCPKCENVFDSTEHRFLGILSPVGMKFFVVVLIVLVLLVPLFLA